MHRILYFETDVSMFSIPTMKLHDKDGAVKKTGKIIQTCKQSRQDRNGQETTGKMDRQASKVAHRQDLRTDINKFVDCDQIFPLDVACQEMNVSRLPRAHPRTEDIV